MSELRGKVYKEILGVAHDNHTTGAGNVIKIDYFQFDALADRILALMPKMMSDEEIAKTIFYFDTNGLLKWEDFDVDSHTHKKYITIAKTLAGRIPAKEEIKKEIEPIIPLSLVAITVRREQYLNNDLQIASKINELVSAMNELRKER